MNDPTLIAAGADADADGLPVCPPPQTDPWATLTAAYQRALWAGDFAGAERVAAEALRQSDGLEPVYERLMAPVLHRVGELWSTGELTVADEHLATEATMRAMSSVFSIAEGRSVSGGARRTVLTANAEGERHGVGLRMVADALELGGHDVIHCGVDTPIEDMISLADSARVDAVAISFTMASSGDSLVTTANRIWSLLPGLPILVGGQGLPPVLPEGPVTQIENLEELVSIVDELPLRLVRSPRIPERRNPFEASLPPLPRKLELVGDPETAAGLSLPHLTTIFDAADEAIATVDVDGIVTAWNRAAEVLYGRTAAEVRGSHLSDAIGAPEHARMTRRRLREAMAGEKVEARDPHRLPTDDSEGTVHLRFLPVSDAGEMVGVALVARDVSDHRGSESERGSDAWGRLWHTRIEHALAEDRFILAAQPIIDLATNEVDHCELLLRMRMGGEIVMPNDFIPPAERSGQIRAIDVWVAEHGIELAKICPTAVNLSGASLSNKKLLTAIESTLKRTGVDPNRVTFEITETAAAENIEEAAALVTRLRELGCRVALDDFGTGFGSFTYLSRLPVTELKIDNEFARGVRTGIAERQVIDAVVSVGEAFDIRTVAEGVEDEETLDIIRSAGVDLGQGWHFGKPKLVDQSD